MAKEDKRFARIANNPKDVKFRDFVAAIEACGFEFIGQTGSHQRYRHHEHRRALLNIQPRGGKAKPFQVRQFLALVAEYNLTDV
ncbi:MAG: type II toxin-antitoxin system HicA family toxin [Planctomycetota bacterium]